MFYFSAKRAADGKERRVLREQDLGTRPVQTGDMQQRTVFQTFGGGYLIILCLSLGRLPGALGSPLAAEEELGWWELTKYDYKGAGVFQKEEA